MTTTAPAPLPDDPEALRALLLAEHARHAAEIATARAEAARAADERDRAHGEIERLRLIIKRLQRHRFGRRAETLDPDQLALALEDLEQTVAAAEAALERSAADGARPERANAKRRGNRGALPAHLPREEVVLDVEDKACRCCGGTMRVIGEDVAERLDAIPARFRVVVTRRPKYACRACQEGVAQAPAPPRLVEGGLPTERLVAHVLAAKYADHCRSTVRPRSTVARASRSTAPRSPTGSAAPPSRSGPCTPGCWRC